jgi:hypothetical protein
MPRAALCYWLLYLALYSCSPGPGSGLAIPGQLKSWAQILPRIWAQILPKNWHIIKGLAINWAMLVTTVIGLALLLVAIYLPPSGLSCLRPERWLLLSLAMCWSFVLSAL